MSYKPHALPRDRRNVVGGGARDRPNERDSGEETKVYALEKCRTSIDCSPQTMRELEWLGLSTGTLGKAGVVVNALHVYKLLASMEDRGQTVLIRDDVGVDKLVIPSLTVLNGMLRACDKYEVTRLTFELPARGMHDLEALRVLTGEKKKADVIRQAIHLTWALLNEVDKGYSVLVREEDGSACALFVPKRNNDDYEIKNEASEATC